MQELGTNATTWLGIRLDPLGELYIYDFVSGKLENYELSRETVQARLLGVQQQIAYHLIVSIFFTRNLFVAIKALRFRLSNLSGWCCLTVSSLGFGFLVYTVLLGTVYEMACRPLSWYILCAMNLSNVFNTIILLHKAYLALLRPYWVLISGFLFIALQLGYLISTIIISPFTIKEYIGCVFNYTKAQSYVWLATVFPVNTFFSAIFSYVAYKQYRNFGSDAWKRLAKDGIQTMCLVILCNLVCGTLIISEVLKKFAENLFVFDWVFTSTILVNHCENVSRTIESFTATNNRSKELNTTQMDMKETITTYHGRIRGATHFTSFY
ncbi:hypothetical protein BDF19DRAFT_324506 [Syncephalis fuscata]|nr:hypothetical protein BDF19DRAFT_324506 [Syncephalis fuscata]